VFSAQIFQENTFLKTKPNFPLTGKCFLLTNFSNGKQTQESLESGFSETTFRKTNTAKRKNTFLKTKPNFSLTGKCFSLTRKYFPLTNFPNSKQIQESLESGFPKSEFRETNMAYIITIGNLFIDLFFGKIFILEEIVLKIKNYSMRVGSAFSIEKDFKLSKGRICKMQIYIGY